MFRETRKEFRKQERLKKRAEDKYIGYWAQYHTSRNFEAK